MPEKPKITHLKKHNLVDYSININLDDKFTFNFFLYVLKKTLII